MSITALPTPPLRSDGPATFADKGDAFMAALPTFVTQANALESNVDAKEASAVASAATATTKASEALASAQAAAANSAAPKWVSGTTYAIGDVRWSPANYLAYRRKTAGAGTTDPSADATNWVQIVTLPVQTGAGGKFLTTNGSNASWAALPQPSYYQEFLTSGTWTKPADATWVYVEAIGGGASGLVSGAGYVGAGGGGGGFNAATLKASDVTATISVTIGAGGAGSTTGSRNAGGNSSFGAYVVAKGAPIGTPQQGPAGGGEATIPDATKGNGGYSSGAGGCGSTCQGGNCVKGGAGGGSGGDIVSAGAGGISQDGGNGGAGSVLTNATSGSVPGGGGGSCKSGTAGAGGAGRVRIWAW